MASHLVTQVSSSKTPSIYLVMCIKDTINQLEMKKLQFSIRRYTALHPIRPKTDSYSGHLGVTLCNTAGGLQHFTETSSFQIQHHRAWGEMWSVYTKGGNSCHWRGRGDISVLKMEVACSSRIVSTCNSTQCCTSEEQSHNTHCHDNLILLNILKLHQSLDELTAACKHIR
jgi:hypothetical protein